MQSMIGHTDTHKVQPVQSSVTLVRWVLESKRMAWYPESLQVM